MVIEMVQTLGDLGTEKLNEITNTMYGTGKIPEDISNQHPLPFQKPRC